MIRSRAIATTLGGSIDATNRTESIKMIERPKRPPSHPMPSRFRRLGIYRRNEQELELERAVFIACVEDESAPESTSDACCCLFP